MVEYNLSRNQKVIVYLISRLRERVVGRTKLMKLMFLIEHYDPDTKRLSKEQFLGNDFIIYHYGVFSPDVMEDYSELSKTGILDDDYYPPTIKLLKEESISPDLSDTTISRIDRILDEFKEKEGYELDSLTLKLLGLTKKTKTEHFEESVIPLIIKSQRRPRLRSIPSIHSLF
jgi:hypothetical protein